MVSKVSLSNLYSRALTTFNLSPVTLHSPKAAKLSQVESRLGMSRSAILTILAEAGYTIPDKGNYTLTYEHLFIISKAYEKSLKRLFKKVKKQIHVLDPDSLHNNFNFFKAFVRNTSFIRPTELFNSELDSELIQNWVIQRCVICYEEIEQDRSFIYILHKLKFRLQKFYRDLRIQISSILRSHHYYVFPSEEDHSEKLNATKSFSDSLISGKRKAAVECNPIKAFNNDRYTIFNSTHTTM